MLLVGMHNGGVTLENTYTASSKLNLQLPRDPTRALLGIYPKEMEAYGNTYTCTRMFIAALFGLASYWGRVKNVHHNIAVKYLITCSCLGM